MTVSSTRLLRIALVAFVSFALAGPAKAQTLQPAKPPVTMPPPKPAVRSTTLTVTAAGKTITYTLEDLKQMPQRQLLVHNGSNGTDETYSGVGLDDLLAKSGFTATGDGPQTVYRSYVRAEGTDHYFVLCSMSELERALNTGDAIVALTAGGKRLGEQGTFKLVLTGEKHPSRWVRNLSSLRLVTIE